MPDQCYICGSADETVRYCGACKEYLCERCRRNPIARARAVAQEAIDRIFHN